MGPRSSTDGTLTAANLIDAIITHQINQSVSDPPVSMGREAHRPNFVSFQKRLKRSILKMFFSILVHCT